MHSPSPLSRRRLLKQTMAFSAALAFGGKKRLVGANEINSSDLHLMMIGDWGWTDPKAQAAVASGMKHYAQDSKITPSAMLLLGDNFYGGLKAGGTKSPRWKTQFEDMYPADIFPGPCFTMLGNHDYDDDPKNSVAAQLGYAKASPGTRWTLPSKWYAFEFPKDKPLVKFIVLDSNYKNRLASLSESEKAEQNKWFASEIAKPRTTPWLVVMAHHPLYSNGQHGDHVHLIADWEPLLKKHKADFYFSGHDHDLQHMEFEKHPTSFVLSGGGGARIREIGELKHGPYGKSIYGFTHLEVNRNQIIVRHLDANRNQLHAFSKTTEGRVSLLT